MNLKLTTLATAALALALVGLSTGAAEAKRQGSLACDTLAWLEDNPRGVLIKNLDEGGHTIPRGTTFTWVVTPSGQRGTVTLTADLKPGRTFYIDNVLSGPASKNTDCAIVFG